MYLLTVFKIEFISSHSPVYFSIYYKYPINEAHFKHMIWRNFYFILNMLEYFTINSILCDFSLFITLLHIFKNIFQCAQNITMLK